MLAACGPRQPIVRTDVVEVEKPVYKPLDKRLTTAVAEPAPPPANCIDAKTQKPTVCNNDLLNAYDAMRAWGRLGWGKIKEILDLQPKEPTK